MQVRILSVQKKNMASPQIENGFVRIAGELLAAIMKAELSGSEFRVMMAVVAKTYGWNKKEDQISIGQLMDMTGLTRRGVCKSTAALVNKKALGREQKGTTLTTTYWIQKDYDKWVGREQKGPSEQKGTMVGNKKALEVVNKKAPTIDTIKDTIQKKDTAITTKIQKFFYSEYETKLGEPYVPEWGKDGAIFKGLLKTLSEERITDIIKTFFLIEDPFIVNAGYTIGVFKSQINKLLTGKEAQHRRVERIMSDA
jgi:phage replication O-like protein O